MVKLKLMKPPVLRRYSVGLVGGLIVVASIALFWPHATSPITNYAECVAAGNPIQETYPPICRAGGQSFTGPREQPIDPPQLTNVPFEVLVDGDLGTDAPRSAQTISSQSDWAAYWRNIHAGLATVPPLLPVDFGVSTVVAISEGPQSTTGYVYKIASIEQSATGATVRVLETVPTIGCTVAQRTSNRYYIVRADRLVGKVSFQTSVEHRHCDAPASSGDAVQ